MKRDGEGGVTVVTVTIERLTVRVEGGSAAEVRRAVEAAVDQVAEAVGPAVSSAAGDGSEDPPHHREDIMPAARPAPAKEDPAVDPSLAGDAKWNGRGRRPVFLECRERPGEAFGYGEVAAMAGVQRQSIGAAICNAKNKGLRWAKIGDFHFRKAEGSALPPAASGAVTESPPVVVVVPVEVKGEARPRERGNLAPINPHVHGGAARITHAETPPANRWKSRVVCETEGEQTVEVSGGDRQEDDED